MKGSFRKVLYPAILSTGIAGLMAFFAWMLDMDSEETRLAARAYAPVIGSAWARPPNQAHRMAVVLIDDEALERSGQVWPATYRFHARIARELQASLPTAVFFDIAFTQSRDDPSLDVLERELCELRRSGTAVFLAGLRDEAGELRVLPRLRDATVEPADHDGPVPCVRIVGIEYDPDSVDHVAWSYPLDLHPRVRDDCARGRPPTSAMQPTAAAAVAAVVAQDLEGLERCPMALVWPRTVAREGVGWREPAGPDGTAGGSYCRADWLWWEVLLRPVPALVDRIAGWKPGTAAKPLCVPYETVRAARVLAGEADAMLRERIVLIGTDTRFALDRVRSPLHDSIPGVYLHATALDNLLSYGADVRREPGHFVGLAKFAWWVVSGLVVLVVAVVVRTAWRGLERLGRPGVKRADEPAERPRPGAGPRAIRVLGKLLLFVGDKLLRYAAMTSLGVILAAAVLWGVNVSLLGAVWLVQLAALADLFDLPERICRWWHLADSTEREDTR